MRKFQLFLIAFFATTILSFGQWTSIPIYESFDYAEGNLGLSTATEAYPWNYGSTRSAIVASGPNLVYAGMVTTDNKVIKLLNTGSAANIKTKFPAQTGAVYASFLLQALSTPTEVSVRIVAFGGTTNSSGTFSPGIFIDKSGTKFKVGIDGEGGSSSDQQSAEFELNTTVMVIMKYTPSTSSAGGVADFWLNPTSASTSSAPTFSSVAGGVIQDVSFLTLKTGIGAADVLIDELHISTSWSDVSPSTPDNIDYPITKTIALSSTILKDQVSLVNCFEIVNVEFYTYTGNLVKSVKIYGNNAIYVGDLNKGLYLIRISSSTTSSVTKAIKL